MRKTLLPVLLAGVVMPFAAFAQDAQAPAAGTAPAMTQDAAPTGTMEPAASPDAGESTTTTTTTAPAGTTGTTATTDMETDTGTAVTTDMDADTDTTVTTTTPDMDAGSDMTSTAALEGPFVTVPPSGAWRASDLEGKDVYDTMGENIGSISDVLLSEEGEVIAVLVGVGGFLGIGQKDVAVAMDALEFGPGKTEGLPTEAEVEATAAAAPATDGMAADPAAPAGGDMTASTTETEMPVVGEDNLPDRIVLNVTREELEGATAYGETEDAAEMDTTGAAPAAPASDTGMAPATEVPAQQ